MQNKFSRREMLKYLAAGSVTYSLAGNLLIPKTLFAQENEFIPILGGSFLMGSPVGEFLRESDELPHRVEVGSFYMAKKEVTQREYQTLMGFNPSQYKDGYNPVENVTWYDAIRCCNARSEREGLEPAYSIDGFNVTWDRSANGYRLPTEAEWEYAARAGTTTPFYTGANIATKQANWYGIYPYDRGEQGRYRQKPVRCGSFGANPWGLQDISGNVWEWCWDWYGAYDTDLGNNPTGLASGVYKVHRGGGWNDFGRHLRTGYRAAFTPENRLCNIGFRIVRNADRGLDQRIHSTPVVLTPQTGRKNLVIYFSWSGNTRMFAEEIHNKVGGDLVELEMQTPYSRNYSTCLSQTRKDQQMNVRPALKTRIDMDLYDVIYLGYPTWWATTPMPVRTFLEQYDFSEKTIIPFASHGEGLLAQTLSAIAKSAPRTTIKEAHSILYSDLSKREMNAWLERVAG